MPSPHRRQFRDEPVHKPFPALGHNAHSRDDLLEQYGGLPQCLHPPQRVLECHVVVVEHLRVRFVEEAHACFSEPHPPLDVLPAVEINALPEGSLPRNLRRKADVRRVREAVLGERGDERVRREE